MDRKLVYTPFSSEEIVEVPDENLKESIIENFDFQIGYIPEGYNIAFLLIKDDIKDSRKDEWKAVFYKATRKFNGTITLDNLEDFDENSKKEYEFFKIIDGNYEDMINIGVDLLKRYREENDCNKVSG